MCWIKINNEKGFTLLELLLAGAILALIMGAIVLALSQTLSSIEHSRKYLERTQMTQLIFERWQKEIPSAFATLDKESLVFIGQDQGEGEEATDTLELQIKVDSLSHLVSEGIYQVTYQLRDSPSSNGKQLIWSAAPVRGGEVGEAREQILAEGIKGLNFQYYYQNDWANSFDATTYGFLPQAVKITLAIEEAKGVTQQELVVDIPIGGQIRS